MRFSSLIFFIWLLSVDAQRRSVASELLSENEPQPKTARRGRARFTLSDVPQTEEQKPESPARRLSSRRRPESRAEVTPVRASYEVQEVVDEVPNETFRKTKIVTETKFEAKNAPPSNTLFQPSTTEDIEEIIQSIGIGLEGSTASPFGPTFEPSSSEIVSSEIPNEISRVQPEITTPLTPKVTRRSSVRSRSQIASSTSPAPTRVRTRTRANRRLEEQTSTTPSNRSRSSRRRPEVSGSPVPSVVASAESVEVPTRSRTGRKLPNSRRSEEVKSIEKTSNDAPYSRRSSNVRNENVSLPSRTSTIRKSVVPEDVTTVVRKNINSERNSNERRSNIRKNTDPISIRSRSRFRSSDAPPVLDEQKLEVLPLFERESKIVPPSREFLSRRRHFNSAELVETSATENEVKVASEPIVETRSGLNNRRRKIVKKTIKPSTTPITQTTTRPTSPTIRTTSKPIIKESVISEITEVTSKRTITRRKSSPKSNTIEAPKFVSRSTKNLKKTKSALTSSEEEIEESDNYPEPFKQLLQARKEEKESRSQQRLVSSAPVTKVVISSPSTTAPVVSTEASRQLEDAENDLDPAKILQSTRRRFSPTSAKPTRKHKASRPTAVPAVPPREHRFHAKAGPEFEDTTGSPLKNAKGFSPKPTRGLYSSRKTKESSAKSKSPPAAQISTPKKSNRYSSRYRNDASSRTAIRTSTNAPAYLPTIPTVTPTTTSVKSPLAYRDKDLGVEIISFDDPVNTVPSENLVSGEYLANHPTGSLVSASQTKTTEKPVSFIERIINSITAISTTEKPDLTTTHTQESTTKQSAILKLATKRLDKTQTTQKTLTVTSENPTTIIERILSSLSAIQADSTNSKQVGTNFNTISSPSTTPITRVTKSTLPAQLSTTVNPLFVLDEIANEQTLQKRTIDKLLVLLNTLTTPHSQLVVVTPKSTSYVAGTSATTTTEPTAETTTTTATTASSTSTVATTTSQLFTSPSANLSFDSRANIQTSTVRYTQMPTTTLPPPPPPTTTTTATTTTTLSTEGTPSTTTDFSNDISALPLSFDFGGSESTTPSSTDSSSSTPRESTSTVSSTFSTEFLGSTDTTFLSTLPALVNFEVSPGSVSIFSANDLSNIITHEDSSSTTVAIPGRTNSPETVITTQSNTETTTPTSNYVSLQNRIAGTTTTTTTAAAATTTENDATATVSTVVPSPTITMSDLFTTMSTTSGTTSIPSTTTASTQSSTTTDLNTTQDISSNIIDTTGSSEKPNTTTGINPPVNVTSRTLGRSGRVLSIPPEPVPNSVVSDKDYFIFAVLNNNTVLRKRPSRFPNKDTPYLIVGVYPNNTVVRKFPNGTLVPMEPVIRVSGFDTRENPPPLPEITSNQVTPDEGSRPDNKNLQTVEQNTVRPLEANPLSLSSVKTVQANPLAINSTSTSTTSSSTSSSISPSSTTPGTTTTGITPTATLPTLTEILNGRTVQAFNSIINISDLNKVHTLEVDPKAKPTTTTALPTTTLSNGILDVVTALPTTTTSTTSPPITTVVLATSTLPSTTATFTASRETTALPLTQPATTTYRSTTSFPLTTTFFPTFLSTLFSTFRPQRSTEVPLAIVTPISNTVQSTTTPQVDTSTSFGDLFTASSTRRTSRVPTTTVPSTLPISTTVRSRRRGTTTTSTEPTTTIFTTTTETTTSVTNKLRKLTEQQKKDLETLAQLEREQAAILRQLAFLTNLNFANSRTATNRGDLANRIIALAVERDNDRKKTTTPAPEIPKESRQAKKISPSNEQNVEQLLKQLNIATPPAITTEYGKSDDAIIAALLKERGIGPTTPKALEDIYTLTTTTRRPKPTTRRPGPLMQSLNWLLNALAPPTTKRPKRKPKPKPKAEPTQDELLTHQPTHITPVVTSAPRQSIVGALSQDDIQKLIKQLEALQKDPGSSGKLDFSSIQSLQGLLDAEGGVKVISSGTTGTVTTTTPTTVLTTTKKKKKNKNRVAKSTTAEPLSVSNNILEDFDSTTTQPRITLPPVQLRPVPGIQDETLVRGQLITAAVNVTRAISSFLGTALQGAANGFQSLWGSGSRAIGSLMQVSSNTFSRPS